MKYDVINVYCDESCHLENEECKTMVIACIRCPESKVKEITNYILALKKKHGVMRYVKFWLMKEIGGTMLLFLILRVFVMNNGL